MTRLKRVLKKFIHTKVPGARGRFFYFGSHVYFPDNSLAFSEACRQGIYEKDNADMLRLLARPATWMFDVGANIGLMALPVLHTIRGSKVLSFEPSANSAPWLEKTIARSPYRERWSIVKKAVGSALGTTEFTVSSPESAVFDSIVDTHRVGGGRRVSVEMTTLDHEWSALGRPEVSVIKIDVEGWETKVLEGGRELIEGQRPQILLEWQSTNLAAAGVAPAELLGIADSVRYRVRTVPEMIEIRDVDTLELQMLRNESFLLSPISFAR